MGADPFAGELPGMPALDSVEKGFKTYFFITKRGMDLHLSKDALGPFDDDDGNRSNR